MKRIQRQRTKGWRMPEGAVYVGRPSRWGNPFIVEPFMGGWAVDGPEDHLAVYEDEASARARAVAEFRAFLPAECASLRGRDLVCWCPLDQPCHADVLLELANEEDVVVSASGFAEGVRALHDLRRRLFVALEQTLRLDGSCKPYEGRFAIVFPNYFEQGDAERWAVTLDCYLIGPHRHYSWTGRTLLEAVTDADHEVSGWLREHDEWWAREGAALANGEDAA